MSLRLKLLSGYALFILALVGLGAWSAWRLQELGKVARLILAENYDSVVAAQEMKESLERQDSGAVVGLLGQTERAQKQILEQRHSFDAAFERAANNITEPGERELVDELRRERERYYHDPNAETPSLHRSSFATGNAVLIQQRFNFGAMPFQFLSQRETLHLFLFSGFRFKANEQRYFDHDMPPIVVTTSRYAMFSCKPNA